MEKIIEIINKIIDPRVFTVVGLLLGIFASFLPQPAIFLLAMAIGAGLGAYSIFHLIITLPFFLTFEVGFIGGVALGLASTLSLFNALALTIGLVAVFIVSMLAGLLTFLLASSGFNLVFSERQTKFLS